MPPSPWLSARMTRLMYLKLITKLSDQSTSDRMPSTLAGVAGTPCTWSKHCFRA